MSRLLVIAVALLGACGDKQLEQLRDIKEEVCACKTVACGEAAMKKVPQGDLKTSRKMQHVARDMMECMAKLNAGDRPVTDPDADQPESGSAGSAQP